MADDIVGNRYRLDEQLARGGTATVWRGVDLHSGHPVAVKVMDPTLAGQPVALTRLRREAQTIARLAHPNIVAVHDSHLDGQVAFLVMELVDGRSLADLLTVNGPLPVDRAVSIAEQACAALAAAHTAGVIHRDVKPGNLLISGSGAVKVCDFGIARVPARDGQAGLTANDRVVGTCEYMAPEQATGDQVDGRTDLYALGCVLYAMLAGQPPFRGANPMSVLDQHLHQPAQPLSTLRGDVPPTLDQLVGDLLAKGPADRPASATEVRGRLAAILSAQPIDAPAAVGLPAAPVADAMAAPTQVLPRLTGRHRYPSLLAGPGTREWMREWWVVLVSTALVLATVLTVAVVLTSRETEQPSAASAAPPSPRNQPSDTPTTVAPASPSPNPRPSRTFGTTPVDRLSAFAAAVQEQVNAGALDREAGQRLLRQLNEIARNLQKGEHRKAAEKLRELDDRLADLREDDKLTAAGFDALNQALASIS